ncbi:MAG: hypothetical protein MRJ92_04985 [Nitrospira sp.]|nr:hypothetical protein [Nitrospira sp.]
MLNLIGAIFRAQGPKLVEGLVKPNTTRNNWGLLSLFETNVLDQPVLVLGVAGAHSGTAGWKRRP